MTTRLREMENKITGLPEAIMHVSTDYQLKKVGIDWHDIWVGIYWKYAELFETDGDYDRLTVYICLLPCLVISFTRQRNWQVIPRVGHLDPLCLDCKQPKSLHTTECDGRY